MEALNLSETSQVRRSNTAQNILLFDSTDGVATRYRLYVCFGVLIPVGAKDFLFYTLLQTNPGANPTTCTRGVLVLSRRAMRPRLGVVHPPSSSVVIKNE